MDLKQEFFPFGKMDISRLSFDQAAFFDFGAAIRQRRYMIYGGLTAARGDASSASSPPVPLCTFRFAKRLVLTSVRVA